MKRLYIRNLIFVGLLLFVACNKEQKPKIIIYSAPEQELKSDDFEMFIDGKPVFVYRARVSKFPINQIWPGYQRPLNKTEVASFAYFDLEGETNVRLISKRKISTVAVLPVEYKIIPEVAGDTVRFKIPGPMQIAVEVNGYHQAMHIFANPMEKKKINSDGPGIRYFGPGVHDAGIIRVKSGETVYIDGGAVVYGAVVSEGMRNVTITGRGILDASKIERGKAPNMITLKDVQNAVVSGIILRDPHEWAAVPTNCDSVLMDNIKMIGLWRYNSDGIDIVNCNNVVIRNSFIRAFDDNIVIRGTKSAYKGAYKSIDNIRVDSCVLWNDWGRALEIGASTFADSIKNITFSNCYIPHFTTVAMDIQNCDRAVVTDIRFDNIYIGEPITDSLMIGITPIVKNAWAKIIVLGIYGSFYSGDTLRGSINNIRFSNIRYNRLNPPAEDGFGFEDVTIDKNITFRNYDIFIRDNMYFGDIEFNCKNSNTIYLSGFDQNHRVEKIFIKDYYINGGKVTDLQTVGKNEFTSDVVLE